MKQQRQWQAIALFGIALLTWAAPPAYALIRIPGTDSGHISGESAPLDAVDDKVPRSKLRCAAITLLSGETYQQCLGDSIIYEDGDFPATATGSTTSISHAPLNATNGLTFAVTSTYTETGTGTTSHTATEAGTGTATGTTTATGTGAATGTDTVTGTQSASGTWTITGTLSQTQTQTTVTGGGTGTRTTTITQTNTNTTTGTVTETGTTSATGTAEGSGTGSGITTATSTFDLSGFVYTSTRSNTWSRVATATGITSTGTSTATFASGGYVGTYTYTATVTGTTATSDVTATITLVAYGTPTITSTVTSVLSVGTFTTTYYDTRTATGNVAGQLTATTSATTTSTGIATVTRTYSASGTGTLTAPLLATVTRTRMWTATDSATGTWLWGDSGTQTVTNTAVVTGTATDTATATETYLTGDTSTVTGTVTNTNTVTTTGTNTNTVTNTGTVTNTNTVTGTTTTTNTVTGTNTVTHTDTGTVTNSQSATSSSQSCDLATEQCTEGISAKLKVEPDSGLAIRNGTATGTATSADVGSDPVLSAPGLLKKPGGTCAANEVLGYSSDGQASCKVAQTDTSANTHVAVLPNATKTFTSTLPISRTDIGTSTPAPSVIPIAGAATSTSTGTDYRLNGWVTHASNDLNKPTATCASTEVLTTTVSGQTSCKAVNTSTVTSSVNGTGNTVGVLSGTVTSLSTTSYLTPNGVGCSAGSNTFTGTNGQITACSTSAFWVPSGLTTNYLLMWNGSTVVNSPVFVDGIGDTSFSSGIGAHSGGDKVFYFGWVPGTGITSVAGHPASLRWHPSTGKTTFEWDGTARSVGGAASPTQKFGFPTTSSSSGQFLMAIDGSGSSEWDTITPSMIGAVPSAERGLVIAASGDTPDVLYNRIVVGAGLDTTIVGTAPNRQVRLSMSSSYPSGSAWGPSVALDTSGNTDWHDLIDTTLYNLPAGHLIVQGKLNVIVPATGCLVVTTIDGSSTTLDNIAAGYSTFQTTVALSQMASISSGNHTIKVRLKANSVSPPCQVGTTGAYIIYQVTPY